ncbi:MULTISPECIES: TonB-dependent receptor [unclassified Sphingobium]|uniref:TonB-dependent receptor n=1 Tax=unclassified Sphingobium TaxID=2611147 RepID=UPI0022245EF7|nr:MULTISPECIES: TonB-dependent receptor [unclassified Sphingobium]MCW2393975.1 hypothetical protein [Sphingobium sp. B8D3B]MCW2417489.1 hypothetical protein [Sphingobium sp. B8D3C]
MISLVPGFTLDEGDAEIRGFRQAAGNVVINGRRPNAKSETLGTLLSRIPAARVVRIELASGDRFGTDYAGRALVANVVLSQEGGLAATVETTLRREYRGAILPEGSISALWNRGASTFNVALAVKNAATSEEGFDQLVTLPGGTEQEYREKFSRFRNPQPSGSVRWTLNEGEHRTVNLSASLNLNYDDLTQSSFVQSADGSERNDALVQRWFTRTMEVSGDITRPLGSGGIKLLGLASRRYRSLRDQATEASLAGDDLGGLFQNQHDWRDETLARLSWNGTAFSGWTVEAGVEGVRTRLDGQVDLFSVDPDGAVTVYDLPVSHAVVTEDRGEVFANAGRPLSSRLRIDLGLAYERSRLSVSGDVSARRTLDFVKPKVALDWRHGAWHSQISAERTVAQLDFEDFVSAAELSADRVNGGNPDLLPQRAWEFKLSVDRALPGDGRITLDLGYDFIAKVQDRVPTPEGFDAPGNLGDGTQFSAAANIDLPLSRLGVKGGRLTLYGSYIDTSVRDPYTLRYRPFSGYAPFYYEARFRQDLGRFAWGTSMTGNSGSDSYRIDEVDFNRGIAPNVAAFVEYRPNSRWTVTLGSENLLDGGKRRVRDFYDPDRRSLMPYERELRHRESHLVAYLTIKRSIR